MGAEGTQRQLSAPIWVWHDTHLECLISSALLYAMTAIDLLARTRCRLLTNQPWYGHIAIGLTWTPTTNTKTIGVCITDGKANCYYNPQFIENFTVEELYGIIIHELEHLIRLHCVRKSTRHMELWNWSCDLCCNGRLSNSRIGYRDPITKKLTLPHTNKPQFKGIFIPETWPDTLSAEEYYNWLDIHCTSGDCTKRLKNDGEQQDDHDVWGWSDASEETARQVVNKLVQEANCKSQGRGPGHLSLVLAKLQKPKVRWRELLRSSIARSLGNTRKTYSRRSRRRDQFGIPGTSHRAASKISIILDTSGSISKQDLEQFFAEIEALTSRATVAVLQWDDGFQGWTEHYRKGMWKTFKISGRGGTNMASAITYLEEHRQLGNITVIVTDAECHWPAEPNYPIILCIIGSREGPGWTKQVYIDHSKSTPNR